MRTLVKVVEIWVPDAEGQLLVLGSGLYGEATAFGALSGTMCFGRGEGLPGHVWETRVPVVLKDLRGGRFRRATSAKKAGLACAVALPLFAGDLLKAVIVIFCADDDEEGAGAIEIWRTLSGSSTEMVLVDGCHGSAALRRGPTSHDESTAGDASRYRLSWQRHATMFAVGSPPIPGQSTAPAVATTARRCGLVIPFGTPTREKFALVILADGSAPSAARVESWIADGSGRLRRRALCIPEERAGSPAATEPGIDPDRHAVAQAFDRAIPVLAPLAPPGSSALRDPSACHGRLLALPIFDGDAVIEVLALSF